MRPSARTEEEKRAARIAASARFRARNAEKIKKENAEYRAKNREKIRAANSKYWAENKNRIQPTKIKKAKASIRNNPQALVRRAIRRVIYDVFRGKYKDDFYISSLGCTPHQLKIHLQNQFDPGMTWENRGYRGWHVDHRQPLRMFDLTDPDQRSKASHYSNLQPLWGLDNMKKQ